MRFKERRRNMAFLDDLSNKITATTQNVVRGTKGLTDTARLNSLISEEQRQIANLYSQIGKLYCETAEIDAGTPLGELCLAVTASNERIAKYNDEILEIKGSRRCPNCGADISLNSAFCGACGSKMEIPPEKPAASAPEKRFCMHCGAELTEGIVFCISCGQKQE
jgi:predicted amidophosphoribosyltransferase